MPQKINLFCLPFSGGNSYSYRKLEQYTADFINIVALELPGHGKRMKEPLLNDITEMAEDVIEQMKNSFSEPYAIYGHSMGATLGYVVSQKIVQQKISPPIHLFVSGHQGPSVVDNKERLHVLPKEEFIEKVLAYGGIPDMVAQEKELMDLFVPIMRADFQALETYTHKPAQPLNVPITVMIGLGEDITYEEALKWQEVTTQKISLKRFPGGHFFIFNHLPEIGRIISQTLEKSVSR
jgi:surfactin synthase thioesterase subunit